MNDRFSISKALLAAFTLQLVCGMFVPPAYATSSGLDTPAGVTSLPLAVEGVAGMTLVTQDPANGPIYVGIGTTAPWSLLNVFQSANAQGNGLSISNTVSDNTYLWGDANGIFHIDSATNGSRAIVLNGGGAGNVGIGTSPQTTLDVNGPVRAGSATVNTACSPVGALAYDSVNDIPVFCSSKAGNLWLALGLPSTATWHSTYCTSPNPNSCSGNIPGGRAYNTVYTNTHGYPIGVSVSTYLNGRTCETYIWVNGTIAVYNYTGYGYWCSGFAMVPTGATYELTTPDTGYTVLMWAEVY